MNERTVMEQRLATLAGLLAVPGGPLGPNAGPIAAQLRGGWECERRLIERILVETAGDDVRGTVAAWRNRTAAFVARSGDVPPRWTDREGHRWDGPTVLTLLDEIQERLDRWQAAASGSTDMVDEEEEEPDGAVGS